MKLKDIIFVILWLLTLGAFVNYTRRPTYSRFVQTAESSVGEAFDTQTGQECVAWPASVEQGKIKFPMCADLARKQ